MPGSSPFGAPRPVASATPSGGIGIPARREERKGGGTGGAAPQQGSQRRKKGKRGAVDQVEPWPANGFWNYGDRIYDGVGNNNEEMHALVYLQQHLRTGKALYRERKYSEAKLELDQALSGLTKEQRTELYGKLFVPINLNTATDEEILLIPRLGNRMLREFKEYRPYESLAKFHREIGKYVDDTELARLEQYVKVEQKK